MIGTKPRLTHKIGYFFYCIVVVIPLLEMLLWIGGYRPYEYIPFSIKSHPERSIVAHEKLGFQLREGLYQVQLNNKINYQASHSANGLRTYPEFEIDSNKLDIALFGCSYTYGMGVDDEQVMSAIMAKEMSAYNVINYGVPGYGNVQGYYQLQELVKIGTPPSIAVFNFADFHIERNVLSPEYRLHLNIGYVKAKQKNKVGMDESHFPYVFFQGDSLVFGQKEWKGLYQHWQGRETFALVNLLQTISDQFESHSIDKEMISLQLFQQIAAYCDLHHIRLLVVGLAKNSTTSQFLSRLDGIETLDASLSLENSLYSNLPIDSHPNKIAHAYYAQSIIKYLSESKPKS